MIKQQCGATPQEWQLFEYLQLMQDLLPVVTNQEAPIAPNSTMKTIGKTPSQYNDRGEVIGLARWTERKSSPKLVEAWSMEPSYGICIQTRQVRALDIDVDDEDKAEAIRDFVVDWLGLVPPLRYRDNSGKCLFGFQVEGDDLYKRVVKVEGGLVEFLATGQQFVAAGQHPSGARYQWVGLTKDGFPSITQSQFEDLWFALCTEFGIEDPVEARGKREYVDTGEHTDEMVKRLIKKGLANGNGRDGAVYITCPFEDGHSTEDNGTSTAYFPAGSGGYDKGHFKCLHASCAGRKDDEFIKALGLMDDEFEDLRPLIKSQEKAQNRLNEKKFKILSAHEFSRQPSPRWRIKNLLPEKGLALIFGASGSGKSFIALDLAFSIALGKNWNNAETKSGKVVYIAAEGANGIRMRLQACARHYETDLKNIGIGIIDEAPDLTKQDDKILLQRIEESGGADVIFIDTLAQTTPGADENTAKDMNPVIQKCNNLYKKTGALVVLIHHSGKEKTKGARGWSGIRAALDTELNVTNSSSKNRCLTITKQKDGEEGKKFHFKLIPHIIGLDEAQDEIVSCAVQYDQTITDKPNLTGKWQKPIYNTIITSETAISFEEIFQTIIKEAPNPRNTIRKDVLKRSLIRLIEADILQEGPKGFYSTSQNRNQPQ